LRYSLLFYQTYSGQEIKLAGDNLTGIEIVNILSKVSNKQLIYQSTSKFTRLMMKLFVPDILSMFNWFENVGYKVNIKECQKYLPEINNFQTWAEKHFQNADIGQKQSSFSPTIIGTIIITVVIGCMIVISVINSFR